MLGTGARRQTVGFLGWFGPARPRIDRVRRDPDRGRAACRTTTSSSPTVMITIGLSVLAHGLTAAPLANRYAAWFESHPRDSQPKLESGAATHVRWRTPTRHPGPDRPALSDPPVYAARRPGIRKDRIAIEVGGRHVDRTPTSVDGTEGVETAVSYRVATVDELQDIPYRQDTHMRPVRHHLGITAFGTNAWTATKEGDRLMPEHAEDEGSRGAVRRPPRHGRGSRSTATPSTRLQGRSCSSGRKYPDSLRGRGGDDGARGRQQGRGSLTRPAAGRCGPSSIPRTRPATTRA